MQKLQGWVEQGNTTLTIGQAAGVIARKVQGSYPGATVTVYLNNASAVAISSISRTSNVVTVTIPSGSGFIAGEQVTIAGVTDASFNGTFIIVSSGATTFTYAQTAANASSSGGTATSTLRLANIYSDNLSSPTAKSNPFTSASDGTWFFYAPNGTYDVKFSGAGITAPFTLGGFTLFDENVLWIDVTAAPYFAKGDGSADDTAAIQAAINAISANGGTIYFPMPSVSYRLTSTLTITTKNRFKFICAATQGGLDSSFFTWDGPNGGTVLTLDRCRDSILEGIAISPGTGTIAVGIRIDNVNAPVGGVISINITCRNCLVRNATTGYQIGNNSTGNNSEHVFEDCWVTGTGTYGWYINNSQSKNIRLYNCAVSGYTYGIYQHDGSFKAMACVFSNNGTDFFLNVANDPITIDSCYTEGSGRFLDDSGISGQSFDVSLIGNLANPNAANVDGFFVRYRFRGVLTMIGNNFTGGSVYWAGIFLRVQGSPGIGTRFVSIGNKWFNDTPFSVSNATYISLMDQYTSFGPGPPNWGPVVDLGNVFFGEALSITSDLTVNTINVNSDGAQNHLLSGKYTPTITNVANISASSLIEDFTYSQIGSAVWVSGRFNVTPTATGNVLTEIDFSVPVLNGKNIDACGGAGVQGLLGSYGCAGWEVQFGNANKFRLICRQVDTLTPLSYSFIGLYHLT